MPTTAITAIGPTVDRLDFDLHIRTSHRRLSEPGSPKNSSKTLAALAGIAHKGFWFSRTTFRFQVPKSRSFKGCVNPYLCYAPKFHQKGGNILFYYRISSGTNSRDNYVHRTWVVRWMTQKLWPLVFGDKKISQKTEFDILNLITSLTSNEKNKIKM